MNNTLGRTPVFTLMLPNRLARVWENEARYAGARPGDKPLALVELFSTLEDELFRELSQKRPTVAPSRQTVQSFYVELLVSLAMGETVGGVPAIAQRLARARLAGLNQSLSNALKKVQPGQDAYTHAHLTDVALEVQRALEAIRVVR